MTRLRAFVVCVTACCLFVLSMPIAAEIIPTGEYECAGINYATQEKLTSKAYLHIQGCMLKVHWVIQQEKNHHYHSLLNPISSTVFAGAVRNKARDDVGTEKMVFSPDYKEANLTFFTYNRTMHKKNYGKASCKKIDLG